MSIEFDGRTRIVAWSINHGQNDIQDHWIVYEPSDCSADHIQEAEDEYAKVLDLENLHCATIAIVEQSTDHW